MPSTTSTSASAQQQHREKTPGVKTCDMRYSICRHEPMSSAAPSLNCLPPGYVSGLVLQESLKLCHHLTVTLSEVGEHFPSVCTCHTGPHLAGSVRVSAPAWQRTRCRQPWPAELQASEQTAQAPIQHSIQHLLHCVALEALIDQSAVLHEGRRGHRLSILLQMSQTARSAPCCPIGRAVDLKGVRHTLVHLLHRGFQSGQPVLGSGSA